MAFAVWLVVKGLNETDVAHDNADDVNAVSALTARGRESDR